MKINFIIVGELSAQLPEIISIISLGNSDSKINNNIPMNRNFNIIYIINMKIVIYNRNILEI